MNSVDKVGGSPRGRTTWLIYIVTGCFGYLLNGLGVVLQPLQESLGVSRDRVAFYPTLLAVGLVGVGLGGGRLVGAFGRTAAFRAALIALVCGAALLTLAQAAVSLLGAVILGAAGALLIQLTPAALSALHPERAAVTVGEASACSSAASVIAPLAIAAGLTTGIGWRPGYLLPLVAAVPAVLALRALPEPAPVSKYPSRPGYRPIRAALGRCSPGRERRILLRVLGCVGAGCMGRDGPRQCGRGCLYVSARHGGRP